jgi:diaminopimelate epimerase
VSAISVGIPFVKASACGNDFLLIEAGEIAGKMGAQDLAEFSRKICDRHNGVGADGVEWMYGHESADVEIRLINADGSKAEISGNGTRCVAAYIFQSQGKQVISLLTGAGLKMCAMKHWSGNEYEFETEMGEAVVGAEFAVKLEEGEARGIPVSMGNPHFVRLLPEFAEGWRGEAAAIQRGGEFPQGVNVEMVRVDGEREVSARFFERGAGETQSSGTGSCAAAVAAVSAGRVEFPVAVNAPGGAQIVDRRNGKIFLRGPARLVCRGHYFPD